MSLCPACENKRPHSPEEWKNHPYAGHGYQDGQGWSHRDLEPKPDKEQDADRP
jgi:hypothetical protein